MAELFFGDFRFDTRRLQLEGAGGPVEVRPRTLELLTYLIQHRNRFVPREELLEALWKDVTVTAASLTQCISELRHALGDSAREPRYVETRIKMGYRFVAVVYHRPTERLEELPPPSHVAPPPRARRNRRTPRWLLWPAPLLLMAALAVGAWQMLGREPSSPRLVVVSLAASEPLSAPAVEAFESLQQELAGSLAGLPGVRVSVAADGGGDRDGLRVEIACAAGCEQRLELNLSLRGLTNGEELWGWTWDLDEADVADRSFRARVVERVTSAVRARLQS